MAAMKRTQMEKLKGAALQGELRRSGAPDRFGSGSSAPLKRREQRELERAQGLVPFAVKLDGELVKRLHDLSRERQVDLGQLVGELLRQALDRKAK